YATFAADMPQAPTAVLRLPGDRDLPRPFGAFSLLKLLARDERGEVFVGLRPERVDRFCVVNVLAPAFVERAGVTASLRAEAGWLVARVHGNLVQTYDVGQLSDRFFLVNEYVDGRDLGALMGAMAQPGGLPMEAAVYVALEVAAALGFIRSNEERVTG